MQLADVCMDVASSSSAVFLSLVFLRALLHKIGDHAALNGTIREYRVMPDRMAPLAGNAVVVGEACTSIGLMLPQTRTASALLACSLLLVYTVAIAINLRRGRTRIDCGCGGAGQGISGLHVVRNVVLALCAVPAMAFVGSGPTSFWISAVTAGCVLVLWFMFLAFDQLLGNRAHATATEYSFL